MSNKIKEIAMRLKDAREIAGLSVEGTASALGVSAEVYGGYETGNKDIPISILCSAAEKFHVELTAILTGDEPKLSIYNLVRAGEGIDIERRKEYKYLDLAYNFKHKKAEFFTVTIPFKDTSAPTQCYAHAGHEAMFVTEGRYLLTINKKEITMNPGDFIYFDSAYEHGMLALDGKPAKFLSIVFN